MPRNPPRKNSQPARAETAPETEAPTAAAPAALGMPRLLTLHDLTDHYRIPRSTAYEMLSRGTLEAVKLGGRTLILTESVERLLASLPRFGG
jgi:excisionase family DNA binding protein